MVGREGDRKRPQRTVTLDADLLDWVEARIKPTRFYNLSHAIDAGLTLLKEHEEGLWEPSKLQHDLEKEAETARRTSASRAKER